MFNLKEGTLKFLLDSCLNTLPTQTIPYPSRGRYCSPPPHVTAQKPDLAIIDRMEEKMDIFELTVPLETNIKNANTQR